MNVNKYLSVTKALEELKKQGYAHSFLVNDGFLKCIETGKIYLPKQLTILEYHRFEGISDEEDMAVIYAIECFDGVLGVIVDAYGTYADAKLANVIGKINIVQNI